MKIVRCNDYDTDITSGSAWSEIVHYGRLGYLDDVKNDLLAIKKLNETKFKDLSDEEFVDLVSNFYSIMLTRKDVLNILSKVNGVEYDKIQQLNTRMTFKEIEREGHGRDFSWWEETYQVYYVVATAKDITLDQEYNYSKAEINQMAKNKQIVSLGKFKIARGIDPDLPYKPEKKTNLNMLNVFMGSQPLEESNIQFGMWLVRDNSAFSKEVYKTAVALIRKRLSKKKVLKDCEEILSILNDNLNSIKEVVEYEFFSDDEDDRREKKKYLALLKDIKQKTKSLILNLNY